MKRLVNASLALSLALATGLGCDGGANDSLGSSNDTIINGDPVPADGFPTVGLVVTMATISQNGGPAKHGPITLCTGTLISPTAVLLAAHCVDQMILTQALQQQNVTVQGDWEWRFSYENSINAYIEGTGADRHFVDKPSLLHVASTEQMPINVFGSLPTGHPSQMDDIAVLHLQDPVKGKPIQKLATPDVVASLQIGSAHSVAGYGQTSNTDMTSGGTLNSGVSKLNEVGAHEVIAGNMDPQQACHGDSGGPIFTDETQALQLGIASRINLMGFPTPGQQPQCLTGLLYTRVDAYASWLQQHVPDLGHETEPCAPNDPNPSCGSAEPGQADAGPTPPGTPDAGPTPPPGTPDAGNPEQPPDGGDQTGGCGCVVGGHRASGTGAAGLLLVGAAFVAVRRRLRRQ